MGSFQPYKQLITKVVINLFLETKITFKRTQKFRKKKQKKAKTQGIMAAGLKFASFKTDSITNNLEVKLVHSLTFLFDTKYGKRITPRVFHFLWSCYC
ncbi:hypothetical protein JTB14_016894 [Gonioctena quinquepunctata]|nr:hypothetical protein JTB14_016894 [Gonioctena quinquepunctata]